MTSSVNTTLPPIINGEMAKIPALRNNKSLGFEDNLVNIGNSAANEALIYCNRVYPYADPVKVHKFRMNATSSAIGMAASLDILKPELELMISEIMQNQCSR